MRGPCSRRCVQRSHCLSSPMETRICGSLLARLRKLYMSFDPSCPDWQSRYFARIDVLFYICRHSSHHSCPSGVSSLLLFLSLLHRFGSSTISPRLVGALLPGFVVSQVGVSPLLWCALLWACTTSGYPKCRIGVPELRSFSLLVLGSPSSIAATSQTTNQRGKLCSRHPEAHTSTSHIDDNFTRSKRSEDHTTTGY